MLGQEDIHNGIKFSTVLVTENKFETEKNITNSSLTAIYCTSSTVAADGKSIYLAFNWYMEDDIYYHVDACKTNRMKNVIAIERLHRIAKSSNPLALLAAAQPYLDNYYQAPKPQRSNATSSSTRPSASTRHKGKEIAKPVTPQSESISDEDSDSEQAQRDKEMQKNLSLLAKYFKKLYKPTNNNLRTSSNSRNKTEDTTPRYNNDNQSRQFGNQRTMTVSRARETVGSQRVLTEESSSTEQPLEQVQNHDENNVFANERRHSEQPESINDTYVLEKDDSNVTPDSSNYM
ncbi:hypothetical protein Tco_0923862 [Tanacetum coccineum]|uniref:Uncharacterized protein n=1 Tax=Tanacetum coccineum TaxID=301880 RepID=A0ABQ5D394_9ASTR